MAAVLTFNDDFNTLSLWDGTKGTWQPAYPWSPMGYTNARTLSSWFVNPANPDTALPGTDPYSINGGILSISAFPTPATLDPGKVGGASFLSGQLTTAQSFSQLYGYFEIRAQLPSTPGAAADFWMIPKDGSWPPELDVFEVEAAHPNFLLMSVHTTDGDGNGLFQTETVVPDTSAAFHTYGVDWEADNITYYFDGKEVFKTPTPPDMNKPMYMILETDVQNGESGPTSTAGFPAKFNIDYVRVYSSKPPDPPAQAAPMPAPAQTAAAIADPDTVSSDTLSLVLSQSTAQNRVQFIAKVDGNQVIGPSEFSAPQPFDVSGAWGDGPHNIEIDFLNSSFSEPNDALFVDQVVYNGSNVVDQPQLTQPLHPGDHLIFQT